MAQRSRLLQRLGQDWQQAYDTTDRPPLDEGERSSHEQLASVAHGRSAAEFEQLREVDEALARLDGGEYGECESCGEPIGRARLEVRPEARLCIACAEQEDAERRGRAAPMPAGFNRGSVPLRDRLDPDRDHLGTRALEEATQNDPSPEPDEEAAEEAAISTRDEDDRPEA